MATKEIKNVIEALLFSSNSPVTVEQIKDALDGVDTRTVSEAIEELKNEYEVQERAFSINEIAGGFQIVTRPQYSRWIKKLLNAPRPDRLSKPSLETLAIIAYKQPVSRPEIEHIRGVNVDGVLRSLLDKRMIRVIGRKETIGRPMIYGTTKEFLQYFGLSSLSQLPPLEEFVETQTDAEDTPHSRVGNGYCGRKPAEDLEREDKSETQEIEKRD